MAREGEKVFINGYEYTLGERIGGGLEGSIFNIVERPSYVIKILNEKGMDSLQKKEVYNHLRWLKELGKRNENLNSYMTLPIEVLDDNLGYVMLNAYEHDKLMSYITPPKREEFDNWYKNEYTFKKRYQIIICIFDALRKVHLAGLLFTDLSPNNIMVHKTKNQIAFIDTDNIRRRTDVYARVLGTDGYMAPEVYRTPDAKLAQENNVDPKILSNCGKLSAESDIFSAAIIAFQLLTLQHPFIGDEVDSGSAEDEERALHIKTDYIFKEGTTNRSTHYLTPIFEQITTKEIRGLFYRTFVTGLDKPALRPTAQEFLEGFLKAYETIVTCEKCGFSMLYSLNDENNCVNCGSHIDKQVFAIIYYKFKDLTREEVINNIGNYPQYDISMENLRATGGNQFPPNTLDINRIILDSHEYKYLYSRHFEKNAERNKKVLCLSLSPYGDSVGVVIINKAFDSPFLVEKTTGKMIPLKLDTLKFEQFKWARYEILLENKKHGNGFIQTMCRFERL